MRGLTRKGGFSRSCHHHSLGFSPTLGSLCLCSGRPLASAHPLPMRPTARWVGPPHVTPGCLAVASCAHQRLGLQLLLSALSALQQWCEQSPRLHPICEQKFLGIPFSPKDDGHQLLSFLPSLHLPPSGIRLPKAGAMSVFCLFTVLWLPWGRGSINIC